MSLLRSGISRRKSTENNPSSMMMNPRKKTLVMIDDFCQSEGFQGKHRPGPQASLSCSEVVTLAVFGQWAQFKSERAFYRYALSHLRAAFPTLPDREQFNRVPRQHRDVL